MVIQNGVDLERIDNAINEYSPSHSSSDDFINIICIGRLAPQKNLHFLIKIVAKLPSNVRFKIFGEGPLRVNIQHQIDESGLQDRVELCGNIPRDDLFRRPKSL